MIFGGYQAFPTDLWQREFDLAKQRGLNHIEWVLDTPSLASNPILSEPSRIQACSHESGVQVVSVCADFLMDQPLDVATGASWSAMERLLVSMEFLRAKWLVIPCVDQSSILEKSSRRRLARALHRLVEFVDGTEIRISLETDLSPTEFGELLSDFDTVCVGVNYDIGNSASLGFDPSEELAVYGTRVNLLHVKDRELRGGSVPLGSGEANFPLVFSALRDAGFDGPVTLQCFRDQDGVAVFDEQLRYYRRLVGEIPDGS